jgi:hypothetical protein
MLCVARARDERAPKRAGGDILLRKIRRIAGLSVLAAMFICCDANPPPDESPPPPDLVVRAELAPRLEVAHRSGLVTRAGDTVTLAADSSLDVFCLSD